MLAAMLVGAVGCLEEESPVSTAILADVNSLTFEAKGAAAQSFNVISEGDWTVVTPEWVSTDMVSGGAGNTAVSVTVADNVDASGNLQLPRQDTLFLKGNGVYADFEVIIYQKGDTYLGAKEGTVTEAIALEAGTGFGLAESQVVAVSTKGFVVTDGKANLYIDAAAEVALGDKVTLKGLRASYNGLPALASCENIEVKSNAAAEHTTLKDLSSSLAAFTTTSIDYVTVKGATLVGSQIIATDGGKLVFLDVPESFGIAALNAHYVDLAGYYLAKDASGNGPFVMVTAIEDKGANENVKLPVKWNATANDYPKWKGATSASGVAGVIEPVEGFGQISYNWGVEKRTEDGVLEDPESKLDINGDNPRVNGAWVGDYWEFLSYVPAKAGQVIKLEFEMRISAAGLRYWKMQYKDGNEWKDCRKLKSVEKAGVTYEYTDDVAPGGGEEANKVITHVVKYSNDTDAITFRWISMSAWRGNNDAEALANPSTASMRLDCSDALATQPSISVATEAELPNDNVANVEVTVDKSLTFEAVPAEPKSFKVLSDNEVELTADSEWILFVGAEGALLETMTIPANEETEVFVTCAENQTPETREGVITVKSGATTEEIKVTQVSPGVSLEPFVSLVGGNSGDVNFEEGTFNLTVQTNVDFEFSSDASWVTVEAAPETRALVDYKVLTVKYEANAVEEERVAHIRVFNDENNIETVYTLTQAAFVSGVYFQDDFTWIAPWADAGSASDSVAENDPNGTALNIYTHASCKADAVSSGISFVDEFANRGYVDLNPASEVIYTQKYYLKFGKTSHNTGIKLPAIDFGATPVDAVVKFNWACHRRVKSGVAETDPVNIVVEVLDADGNSVFVSDEFVTTQPVDVMEWQDAEVLLSNITSDMRIVIRPSDMSPATGVVNRWYVDNIKVVKPEPVFSETFDWIAPWADAGSASDSVAENDPSGTALNVYTHASCKANAVPSGISFLDEFTRRGYVDLNPASEVIYTQKYYLKFGKTSHNTGIKLPEIDFGTTPRDVVVKFNWACHRRVKSGVAETDPVNIVVEVLDADGNSVFVSDEFVTTQPVDVMKWQDASVTLTNITSANRIVIRPSNMKPESGAVNRWYIDNINIY